METDPVAVVAAQVDAYNARDVDRFLECYSPDAVIEDGSGKVLMRGREAMRPVYRQLSMSWCTAASSRAPGGTFKALSTRSPPAVAMRSSSATPRSRCSSRSPNRRCRPSIRRAPSHAPPCGRQHETCAIKEADS